MPVSKPKSKIKRASTERPPIDGQLAGDVWRGGDGNYWMDVAVDRGARAALIWMRREIDTGNFYIVVSMERGHFVKYQLPLEEAKALYLSFPSRVPYQQAFKKIVAVEKPKSKKNTGKDHKVAAA